MICKWESYLRLLPTWMRNPVNEIGSHGLQELRIRIDLPVEAVTNTGSIWFHDSGRPEDMDFIINAASKYSPWTASGIGDCYITADGGHRVGICGQTTVKDATVTGVSYPSSLCVRVSKDYTGLADGLLHLKGSVFIIGPPGSGKTTLLRDLIRQRSDREQGSVCVVDEKAEIFPKVGRGFAFYPGKRTDVLSGCRKASGIQRVLKNMTPTTIAVDEITAQEDCEALLQAAWCGTDLIATAHAGSREDLIQRPIYKSILSTRLFENLVVMKRNKTWHTEGFNL